MRDARPTPKQKPAWAIDNSPLTPEEQVRGRKPKGDAVANVSWEVQEYLDRHLVGYHAWSPMQLYPVEPHGENAWKQRVQYRAKSMAGAYEVFEADFVMRDGKVIEVIER